MAPQRPVTRKPERGKAPCPECAIRIPICLADSTAKSQQHASRELLEGRTSICAAVSASGPAEYRVYGTRKRSESEMELAREDTYEVFPGIAETAELAPPVDWLQDPFDSRSWRAQLHTFRFLDVLFQMYLKEGDIEALRRARDLVLDWIAQNPRGHDGISEYAWWDKVVGDRAPFFAYLLDAGCDAGILDSEQATTLLRSLVEHADYLVDDDNYTHQTNHGLFQDAGLLILARYLSFLEEAREWRAHGFARFLGTLRRQIEIEEGVHLEHSPEYQFLTINLIGKIRELAGIEDPWLEALLERMRDAGAWFVLPDATVPPIGDSDRVPAPKSVLEAAAGKSGLKVFPSSGWAVVKTEDSALIVSAGYHSHAHKHLDDLGFYLYENGEPVIVEAGKYGYDSDPARQYAVSAAAHNGLVADGVEMDLRTIKPYGSGIEWGAEAGGWHAIAGEDKIASAQGVQHRRLFIYRPGLVLILVDEVASGDERGFKRFLHLGPQLEVSGEVTRLELRGSSFRGFLSESSEDGVSGHLVRGQREPSLQGWLFPEYRSWQETWTVEYECRRTSGRLVTTLSLQEEPVRTHVSEVDSGAVEIAVAASGHSAELIVGASGLEVRAPRGLAT